MEKDKKNEVLDASFIISQAKNRKRTLEPYSPSADESKEETVIPLEEKPEADEKDVVPVVQRDDNRKRKSKGQDYESLFIRTAPTTTRSGKAVYIRKEFHDRIMRIVQVIGFNELSLFSYIDNVLEHHFNTYQEDISELYKKRNPDIF
jgi:hypothetical protein